MLAAQAGIQGRSQPTHSLITHPMHARNMLFIATAVIVVVWQLPYGQQVLYPLTLLATYAHEMGHGLTALLTGAEFEQLVLHADGSGQATWRGNPTRLAEAAIAAGGLLGPTVAGTSLLLLSRSTRYARLMLVVMAALMAVSVIGLVRNTFGVVFILAWVAALALAARVLTANRAALLLRVMAVTLCLSWFTHLDYMFSAHAVVNGVPFPSDSSLLAAALGFTYWFWGGVVAFLSLAMVVLSVRWLSRP